MYFLRKKFSYKGGDHNSMHKFIFGHPLPLMAYQGTFFTVEKIYFAI